MFAVKITGISYTKSYTDNASNYLHFNDYCSSPKFSFYDAKARKSQETYM